MKWIKASHRLPEKLGAYHVISSEGLKQVAIRLDPMAYYDGKKRTWMIGNSFYTEDVEYWLEDETDHRQKALEKLFS